jgi:hypothetical protein
MTPWSRLNRIHYLMDATITLALGFMQRLLGTQGLPTRSVNGTRPPSESTTYNLTLGRIRSIASR